MNPEELRKLLTRAGFAPADLPKEFKGETRDDGSIVISFSEPVRRDIVFAVELPDDLSGDNSSRSIDELPDELPLSFSSEEPVMRWGVDEILSHEKGEADFSRLAKVGAILKNHDPDQIVGRPTKVWLDADKLKGRLTMKFGSTETAKVAKREVLLDKSLRGVSVGYNVAEYVFLKDADVVYKDRIKGPAYVATKWQALEASLTPIPADPTVGVKRQYQPEKPKQERDMNFEAWLTSRGIEIGTLTDERKAELKREFEAEQKKAATPPPAPAPVAPTPAPVAATPQVDEILRAEAAKAERARVSEIMALCEAHEIPTEQRNSFISEGTAVDEVSKRILSTLAKQKGSIGDVSVTSDGRSSFCRAAMEAMDIRTGRMKKSEAKNGGDTVRIFSLVELARESLERANVRVPENRDDMIRLALKSPPLLQSDLDRFMRGADIISTTTSDFPYILAATANKSMLAGYGAVRTSFERWCKIGSLSDFKAMNRVKLSEAGDLQRVYEGGKYRETTFSEDQNAIQVYTYGLKFNISRQAIINDDMNAFTTIPQRLGRSARRLPNILAVIELLANRTLNDGTAVFAAGHNNTNSNANYALDTLAHGLAGIENLATMLAEQRGMQHAMAQAERQATLYMGLELSVILVATKAQEFIARTVVASATDPSQNNMGVPNPIQNIGTIVHEQLLSDSQITGYSTTHYFGVASPSDAPVVEVAFLNGVQEPFMEEADQTDADGRIFKVRLDCGAAAIDYAGMCREQGV